MPKCPKITIKFVNQSGQKRPIYFMSVERSFDLLNTGIDAHQYLPFNEGVFTQILAQLLLLL